MAKFTYLVTVEVPDEPQVPNDDGIAEFYCVVQEGHPLKYQPLESDELAEVVMRERLGCDEDYGFDYTVDYEAAR